MTSGTYSFSVTRDQIITQALLDLGVLGEGEVPTAQEMTDCAFKLNMLVKQWMGKQDFAPGLKMWTRQRADLFLGNTKHQYQLGPSGDNWASGVTNGLPGVTHGMTQVGAAGAAIGATVIPVLVTTQFNVNDNIGIQCGQDLFWTTIASISAGVSVTINSALTTAASSGAYVFNYTTKAQRPLNILTCSLRDVYGQDIPMNFMTLEDYEFLSSKVNPNNQSDPSSIYYESQIGSGDTQLTTGCGQLYIDVYGAQDVTKCFRIVYLRPVQDFDNPTDNPEYPQQWYRALCWGLAKDITGMMDAEWTPTMQDDFTDSLAMAREADSDTTSLYFQPESDTQ